MSKEVIRRLISLAHDSLCRNSIKDALDCYNKVLCLDPDNAAARHFVAFVLDLQGQYAEALPHALKAVEVHKCNADYYSTLANVYRHLDNYQEAVIAAKTACDLRPQEAMMWNNAAMLLAEEKRFDRAKAAYQYALQLEPESSHIRFNYSLLLLALDDPEAWDEYEWRIPLNYSQPRPRYPKVFRDKKVLIKHEQGYGDFLMCARYFPLLRELGAELHLETPRALDRLFPSTYCPRPDLTIYAMSLPLIFPATPTEPYLILDKNRKNERFSVGVAHRAVKQFNNEVRITVDDERVQLLPHPANLAWQSAKKRSLPEDWFDNFPTDVQLFNLQIDAPHPRIPSYGGIEDFKDLAQAVANMDLIITIDTSLAHLAGAMGKETWLILPYDSEWRWGQGDKTSWYPNTRIFRCPKRGDWASVEKEVTCNVQSRISSTTFPES